MSNRHLLRNGAFFVLLAMLFAHAATAANACLRPLSAPAAADAQLSAHCETQQNAGLNLCLYHCADQSGSSGTPLAAAASTPTVVMLMLPPPAIALSRANAQAPDPVTDPPIPIRNCCFRI